MSIWESENVENAVLEALGGPHLNSQQGRDFGQPFLTAYQLAIKVDAAHPNIRATLGYEIGGRDAGRNTLSQYLARELSRRIKQHGFSYPVEGAFVSNEHVVELRYRDVGGTDRSSTLTGSGFDLSLSRLRQPNPSQP